MLHPNFFYSQLKLTFVEELQIGLFGGFHYFEMRSVVVKLQRVNTPKNKLLLLVMKFTLA